MRRILLAATLFAGLPIIALAAPVTGDIDFAGSNTYNASNVSFIGAQDVTSDSGTLALFGTCTGCIVAKNVTYAPFVPPLDSFLSGTNNGIAFALDLDSVFNVAFSPGNSLDFDGTAVLHETGFADTPGEVFFSTQGPNSIEVSFSATAIPTPEPDTLGLLGVGLFFLGLACHRRQSSW